MKFFPFMFFIASIHLVYGQQSEANILRGGYGEGRDWWDLVHYKLDVEFDLEAKTISGCNEMIFQVDQVRESNILQIDLQSPMIMDSVIIYSNDKKLSNLGVSEVTLTGSAYLFSFEINRQPIIHEYLTAKIYFHGSPNVAKKAPWDGGIIWAKDSNQKDWVTIACQGLGASVWFPCKDSQRDEADSVEMLYTCPSDLVCVSNGRMTNKEELNNKRTKYTWKVQNPINNYCMIPYIGDYVNFSEIYTGEKGALDMEFWVLRGNLQKAKIHFMDAARTIEALEHWFGPYPFYEDSYKLVEAPHLGMEHQSAIAYGNRYKKGYLGGDLSGTGIGLQWDYIIIHESGHEWYGNNITTTDIADMWVHEAFTTYSETLFTDYWYGTDSGNHYCQGMRRSIINDKPIIGEYGINKEGSGDMYYKGANMLHTIRTLVGNDSLFRNMLREMNHEFYHETVTTDQIENFMSERLKLDLKPIFDQYLRTKNPPTLQCKIKKGKPVYRWVKCNKNFEMDLVADQVRYKITTKWTAFPSSLNLNPNQYYLFKGMKTNP